MQEPTTYLDQKPKVSRTFHQKENDAIRVSFSNVTLALSEVEASWLAENIQREIREIARAEVASAVPLTVEQRRTLQVGDRVVVRMDHVYPVGDMVYEVKYAPWQLGHGEWVIGLKGITGGYALDRVTGIVSTVHSRGPVSD